MSQNLNLSFSGIVTSLNDFNGLPQGAVDVADNVESRYKNVAEPRRGFYGLPTSSVSGLHFIRLANFYVAGTSRVFGLTSAGDLTYYTGANPWPAVPGDYSSNISPPNATNGKSRFIQAGQNLYLTATDGIRSLSSGSTAQVLRAGVPKGLNIEAETDGSLSGFFNNNVELTTTGKLTSASAIVTDLLSTVGLATEMYATGVDVDASLIVQDLTYTAVPFGVLGNAITIAYTAGGTAGSEIVSVVGSAISVQIQSGVSTATQIRTKVIASAAALLLVVCTVSGTGATAQTAVAAANLAGGLDNTIPVGTKISTITDSATIIIETGDTTAGSAVLSNVPSITGIVAGVLATGIGIPDGAKVLSTAGAGPYTVTLDSVAYQSYTATLVTFASQVIITLDQNALLSASGTPISFYKGSQVGYRMVFGRVETDINSGTITRLGSPSTLVIATNTTPYETNVTVTGTLPKNSENEITFVQLYRSEQTDSIDISPLDQYQLVYERMLVAGDFTARVVTITDTLADSLKGIPLYAGSDREGILQSNNPPPMSWDMCKFRDFTLYANITRPSTLKLTILSVGSPSGIQVGDTITIGGTFAGQVFGGIYTAGSSEIAASGQFEVFSSGTPSQNIADTANSLIRVINFDNVLPVHAILLSTADDLAGQILFESDNPSLDTFNMTCSAHSTAYDPTLADLESSVNTINNGIGVSKTGELEAVPATNLLYAGDTSSDILRVVPLRDYVVVIKTDGIYKVIGTDPGSLVCSPFDLTTKIIGADTAVSLNSGVWMLSNQGVVSISDGGVLSKSIPIDDQLNRLIGSYLDNLTDVAFAVGYESDRKYILCVPTSNNAWSEIQYNFNYVTNCWTTWSRNLFSAFIHSIDGKLYISRADAIEQGVSRERKSANYTDYVDESIDGTILSISDTSITLADASEVEAGDILYQDSTHFSPILSVDLATNIIIVQYDLSFVTGAVSILKAYLCNIQWKQVFGDNPAFVRQFSEGVVLFKNTRFNVATARFVTDFSQGVSDVLLTGTGNALWGLFAWGSLPWGGTTLPSSIRFYIPQDKQLGSYLIPSLRIKQGYSDFKVQAMSISYYNVSQEVGK